MSNILLGLAFGLLVYAAYLGDRFAIPLRPYFVTLAGIVFAAGILHTFGL